MTLNHPTCSRYAPLSRPNRPSFTTPGPGPPLIWTALGLALPSFSTTDKLQGQGKPSPYETRWLRLRRAALRLLLTTEN
jgi:hypothetical protein